MQQSTRRLRINDSQRTYKANALFGALGNAGFRYNDNDIAEAITLTGQAANKSSSKHFNTYMNKIMKTDGVDYVIYADTDSMFIDVAGMVDQLWKGKTEDEIVGILDKVGKKLQDGPAVDSNKEMFAFCNCMEYLMDLKRETISSKGLWTTKKRYALKVHNSEGVSYDEPKIKIKGLELVKTSTPKTIQKKLHTALAIIFDGNEEAVQKYVADTYKEFLKLPIEDISFPRSVNDLDKWNEHSSGTPIGVRAAKTYNKLNVDGKYPEVKSGDTIKFVYLKVPNRIHQNVIGFPSHSTLPKEFGLDHLVDRNLQWEKVFIGPLKNLLDAAGWQHEKKATLDDLLF